MSGNNGHESRIVYLGPRDGAQTIFIYNPSWLANEEPAMRESIERMIADRPYATARSDVRGTIDALATQGVIEHEHRPGRNWYCGRLASRG